MKLTSAQQKFLTSYIPDILYEIAPRGESVKKGEFIKRVSEMDFDGPATTGDCRVAANLEKAGLLTDVDIRRWPQMSSIYVQFSRKGAEKIYELYEKNRKTAN